MEADRCKDRPGSCGLRFALAPVAVLAIVLLGGASASARPKATTASTKGSSCAHPYKVYWLVVAPGHATPLPGRVPGEMIGDTKVIKASAQYTGPVPSNPTPTVSRFTASWKPLVGGLKVCSVRITFNYRKPFISHQWHPHAVTILFNPEADNLVTSLLVTAAR